MKEREGGRETERGGGALYLVLPAVFRRPRGGRRGRGRGVEQEVAMATATATAMAKRPGRGEISERSNQKPTPCTLDHTEVASESAGSYHLQFRNHDRPYIINRDCAVKSRGS